MEPLKQAQIDFRANVVQERTRTQAQRIAAYLTRHPEGLNTLAAVELFGCTRIAARICDLRKEGMAIRTVYDKEKGYYKYVLEGAK